MTHTPNAIGLLIRKNRLTQNLSQESLCHGICAVSYLSKIENGSVLCSGEILTQLFQALGISFLNDSYQLRLYKNKLDEYFQCFLYLKENEADQIMTSLIPHREALHYSILTIDMMLAECYHAYLHKHPDFSNHCELLLEYEAYTDNDQAYLLYLILGIYQGEQMRNYEQSLVYFNLAQKRKRDGTLLAWLAAIHYLHGDYLESITLGDEAYALLMGEGNILLAFSVCTQIAASYANLNNIKKSIQYYHRILALASATNNPDGSFLVHYNIGASYLSNQAYELALDHLQQAYSIAQHHPPSPIDSLLLLQKLVLCTMALNYKDQAESYLTLAMPLAAKFEENQFAGSLKASMAWLNKIVYGADYLHDEEYLTLILKVYTEALTDSHPGFHQFYGRYLIEAYKAQRKYKEALKITEALYVKPFLLD